MAPIVRAARVGAVDHRLHLALEVLQAVGEHLDELQVVDRIEVHDLHDVADDGVAIGEEAGRIDHRHRIVEHAQQLVEAERDALLPVVVARRRLDDEAQHVEPAEEDLQARRPPDQVALASSVRRRRSISRQSTYSRSVRPSRASLPAICRGPPIACTIRLSGLAVSRADLVSEAACIGGRLTTDAHG